MLDLVNPRQTILVTTRSKVRGTEKDNVLAVSWHCPLSFDPPLYGISIAKTRYSFGMLKESKVFCINFMPFIKNKEVLACGQATGETTDKFTEYGLKRKDCETIDCPQLADATATIECEIIDEFEVGDHVMFVGKMTKSHRYTEDKRVFYSGGGEFTTTNR